MNIVIAGKIKEVKITTLYVNWLQFSKFFSINLFEMEKNKNPKIITQKIIRCYYFYY